MFSYRFLAAVDSHLNLPFSFQSDLFGYFQGFFCVYMQIISISLLLTRALFNKLSKKLKSDYWIPERFIFQMAQTWQGSYL